MWPSNENDGNDWVANLPPPSSEEQEKINSLLSRARRPLGPGDPRRHHFIPVFFQKRFAGEDEHLMVTRLGIGTRKSVHVRDIAVWNDLYTHIDEEVGETVAVEKILAEIDGMGASALNVIDWGLIPQQADRAALATWIAFLAVRDPFTRRTMEAMADQMYKLDLLLVHSPVQARKRLRQTLEREPSNTEVEQLVHAANHVKEFEISPHQNDLIKMMLDSGSAMYPYLCTRRVAVFRYDEPGLLLCDRPLVMYQSPEHRDPLRGVGIGNADELWLPIDRRTLVILHHYPNVPECIVVGSTDLDMDTVNHAIAFNASAEIYCHPDDMSRLERVDIQSREESALFQVSADPIFDTGTDGVNQPPKRKKHRRYTKP